MAGATYGGVITTLYPYVTGSGQISGRPRKLDRVLGVVGLSFGLVLAILCAGMIVGLVWEWWLLQQVPDPTFADAAQIFGPNPLDPYLQVDQIVTRLTWATLVVGVVGLSIWTASEISEWIHDRRQNRLYTTAIAAKTIGWGMW